MLKLKLLGLCLGLVLSVSAFADQTECRMQFSTFTPNIFGQYTVKKKLWVRQFNGVSSEECYQYVHDILKRYTNVSTQWSHIDVTFHGTSNDPSSKASFRKP